MGRSCSLWNSGWPLCWRNLRKRTMDSTAVLMMKMEIRPASKGSSGEGEGTLSESKLVEMQTTWSVRHAIGNTQ